MIETVHLHASELVDSNVPHPAVHASGGPITMVDVPYAAAYIGRSPSTVYRLIANRDIAFLRDGRRLFPFLPALDAWLDLTALRGDAR